MTSSVRSSSVISGVGAGVFGLALTGNGLPCASQRGGGRAGCGACGGGAGIAFGAACAGGGNGGRGCGGNGGLFNVGGGAVHLVCGTACSGTRVVVFDLASSTCCCTCSTNSGPSLTQMPHSPQYPWFQGGVRPSCWYRWHAFSKCLCARMWSSASLARTLNLQIWHHIGSSSSKLGARAAGSSDRGNHVVTCGLVLGALEGPSTDGIPMPFPVAICCQSSCGVICVSSG